MSKQSFPKTYFARQDESNDGIFYAAPRKVVHIDDHAIAALSQLYAEVLPTGGIYLDLMSSWRSHLPESLKPKRMVGLGMNADEMADNPQLDKYVVQNLNQSPSLPYENNLFDAVICAVSVQYLVHPVEVFGEVNRVLKPGGVFIVSFSNRCFPTKAVAAWRTMSDEQHVDLVTQYFAESGNWQAVKNQADTPPNPYAYDPLYAVWGIKNKVFNKQSI